MFACWYNFAGCAVIAQRYQEKQKLLQQQRAPSGSGKNRHTTTAAAALPAAEAATSPGIEPRTAPPATADAACAAAAGGNLPASTHLRPHQQQEPAPGACRTSVVNGASNTPAAPHGASIGNANGAACSMAGPAMCGGSGAAAPTGLQLPLDGSDWRETQSGALAVSPDLYFLRMF